MFNKFLYQNKFVIEKHIKFVIETNTQIKFIEQYIYIKQCKAAYMKNLIKKLILKKIYIKLRKNHRWIILTSLKTKHPQYHLKIITI